MSTVRSMPLFDTHKAVKALSHAGFDDAQAEAVVEQIHEAVNENVATKSDFERFVAKLDLERFATKEDLERFTAELVKLELRINEKFDKFRASLLSYALGLVGLAVALTKALDLVVG